MAPRLRSACGAGSRAAGALLHGARPQAPQAAQNNLKKRFATFAGV